MALSLIFDDTSLLLTLVIVLLLSLTIYISKGYQPLVHPLILSRQSDVSPIRHGGQSAIYRNANSPGGLDLASKPRKKVNGVLDIVQSGADTTDWSQTRKRSFYGSHCSNADILDEARRFSAGLAAVTGSGGIAELVVGVCVEADSLTSLEVVLSGCVQGPGFAPIIVGYEHVRQGHAPPSLPSSLSAKRFHAVKTTPTALASALSLPGVDENTIVVVASEQEAQVVRTSTRNKVMLFGQVVAQSSSSTASSSGEVGEAVHAVYWTGTGGWVDVTHANLIAALTAHLAFFPVDSQPTAEDHMHVATIASSEQGGSPAALSLTAMAHPAGLVLPLLALYTGAAFTTSAHSLSASQPTMLYSSPAAASSLASALRSLSKRHLFASSAVHSKMAFLRNGTFTYRGFWDRLVFAKVREALGCSKLRSVFIISETGGVSQRLLDTLRTHLSCVVRQAYLPTQACHSLGSELTAGIGVDSLQIVSSPMAVFVAPVAATHSLDLQAFSDNGQLAPAHVGPPNVTVEVKLVETVLAASLGCSVQGDKEGGRAQDPCGEILVRGHSIAGVGPTQWCSTGEVGSFRSNGTLLLRGQQSKASVPATSRSGRSAAAHNTSLFTILALFMCFICSCQVEGANAGPKLYKRDSSINTTMVETAVMSFLSAPRASWEQGSTQSSILEYYSGQWSVFTAADSRGPPYLPQAAQSDATGFPNNLLSMASSSVHTQDSFGKLCTRVTGDESPREGSALDAAACGEAVLIASYLDGEIQGGQVVNTNGMWIRAAEAQLEYLLDRAPRGPQGAISMRSTGLAYWSDAVYMAPPFLALYGLLTRNQSLLQESYDQARYYIEALRINSGETQGLLRHIVNGTVANAANNDDGLWLTGNGWAAAGMVKVIATIAQSEFASDMQSQINDLVQWTDDILRGCYRFATPLINNYINDTTTFYDAAGSSLIAYATYRLSSLSPTDHSLYVEQADAIYDAVQDKLTPFGTFSTDVNVVDALTFTSPSQASPESFAFLVLLASARRDHQQGNVTGLGGVGTGFEGGSSRLQLHGSSLWSLLGIVTATMLALALL